MPAVTSIGMLARFSRHLATVRAPSEILALLADASVDQGLSDASVVLEVGPDGRARVIAACGAAEALGREVDAAAFGPELAADLLRAFDGRFARAQLLPLVAGGDLYGLLVLLACKQEHVLDEEQEQLASAFVDIAATSLAERARFERLAEAHEALQASRDALVRTERLRALGEMSAGIVHDLKNVLAPLDMQLSLLVSGLVLDEAQLRERYEFMQRVVRRGIGISDRLRSFSRQSSEHVVELVDINGLVGDAIEICRPRLSSLGRKPVAIERSIGAVPITRLEASELISAIANLVANAIDALIEGGTIVVRTSTVDDDAQIEVADDGPGIPPEVAARIFEPFFTTKGARGTGLGLATVYAFVQRSGGRVTMSTKVGEGTCFTLRFPRAIGPA